MKANLLDIITQEQSIQRDPQKKIKIALIALNKKYHY